MNHRWSMSLVLTCFAAVFLAFFYPVLWQDRQFGFRDAAHYYYPLYQRVQQEWDAGRVPLWENEENSGMPLLGNPTAAVLYPLKVIFAVFPYAWAMRLYIVTHTALAFAAMVVLLRSWGTSWTGSGIGGMAYAFGAPILFQSSNVIYLVGAAWLPLGIHAIDRWVRIGRRGALIELALVLSMQVLGGEPQSAYLLGLAGIGYAAGIAWQRAAARRRDSHAGRHDASPSVSSRIWPVILMALLLIWIVGTIALGCWMPFLRPHALPSKPLPWMKHVPTAVNAAWLAAGLALVIFWWRRGERSALGRSWLGLAGAAALAVGLSAAQLLPVVEFTQRTSRAASGGPHEIYPFSLDPARLAGLIWPDIFGNVFDGNNSWAELLRPPGSVPRVWVPSLYLGGMTVALALGSLSFRRGTPWRVWLSVIVLVSALGSLGQYTSPIWGVRAIAEGQRPLDAKPPMGKWGPREIRIDMAKVPAVLRPLIRLLGPLDSEYTTPIRQDDFLRDGDGSIYWLLSTFLPGFRQFRYPAKLFTLTSLGLAALAGIGWDAIGRAGPRRVSIAAGVLFTVSAVLLVAALACRSSILARIGAGKLSSIYGPTDPVAAYHAIVRALAQGASVFAAGWIAVRWAASRPRAAGLLILSIVAADLAASNRHFVLTVPQSTFETTPEILRLIREAERVHPSPGPYRIHRMPAWDPPFWQRNASPERGREMVEWERDTLQPKYGIPLGVEYVHTMGVAELYEYEWYFGGFPRTVRDPEIASALGIDVGKSVVYYPRRTFDMWNARYFVVPMFPNGWTDQFRAYASMILDSDSIYPPKADFEGPGGTERAKVWQEMHDYRILRNRRDHPRAWTVHAPRIISTPQEMEADEERQKAMQEITFEDDPIWRDANRQAFDWRHHVWIEEDQQAALVGYFSGKPPLSSEAVTVRYPSPQRVELDVTLESPGMVVLADVYYPGWKLTIDGVPAPIYPVNRAMRGAAVREGPHHLVYTYAPRAFRTGLVVTAVGLAAMSVLGLFCFLRPVDPAIGGSTNPDTPGTSPV